MLHAAMLKNQAPSAFRAYDSLSQGFADFVTQLRHSFPEVINAARTGTPDSFRVALSQKYSRDYQNPKATATFQDLWTLFDPVVSLLPSEVAAVPLVDPATGQESSSSEPLEPFCGSPLPEAGFVRGQPYDVPGIEDEK